MCRFLSPHCEGGTRGGGPGAIKYGVFKRVNVLLLVLRWIVSLISVFGGIGVIICWAMKEDWKLGVASLLVPAFLLYYVPTRWGKCRNPFVMFAVGGAAAALLQRARLGSWAWPDVGS